MAKKLNMFALAPDAMKIMLAMEKYLHSDTTIAPLTLELIKMRVSQINGCAYCLNMHVKDALKLGETEQRVYLLPVWKETNLFTDKERVALELAERVTLISDYEVDSDLHDDVLKFYTEKEFADLLIAIAQINSWNRFNVSLHTDID